MKKNGFALFEAGMLCVVAFAASAAQAGMISVDASLCTELREGGTSMGTSAEFLVGGFSGSKNMRGYLEFDLSGVTIPEGQILSGVSLTLYHNRRAGSQDYGDIGVYLADPAATVTNDANWTRCARDYDNGINLPWNAGMPDNGNGGAMTTTFLSSVDADALVASGLAANDAVTFSFAETSLAVANSVIGSDGFLKMVLAAPTAVANASTAHNFIGFHSDDAANSDYHPVLTLQLEAVTVPEPGAIALLFGALLAGLAMIRRK